MVLYNLGFGYCRCGKERVSVRFGRFLVGTLGLVFLF